MSDVIEPGDVYHILRAILNELPPGTATLERDSKWGRSQLTPARKGAAGLYGVGDVEDCEIGIVEVTHSHFDDWNNAIEFCREVVRGEVEYTVWRDGTKIVRAQRHHEGLPNVVDVMEGLFNKPLTDLRKETLRFEPYLPH